MKKVAAFTVLLLALTGCGDVYSKANGTEKKDIDGTTCVVVTSQSGSVAVDCDWGQ